jgi:hypothetical protein
VTVVWQQLSKHFATCWLKKDILRNLRIGTSNLPKTPKHNLNNVPSKNLFCFIKKYLQQLQEMGLLEQELKTKPNTKTKERCRIFLEKYKDIQQLFAGFELQSAVDKWIKQASQKRLTTKPY